MKVDLKHATISKFNTAGNKLNNKVTKNNTCTSNHIGAS